MFEEIQGLQQQQLLILKELKRVCEKNDIVYFLTYGTLLGAIRHKGFIPWDDDVDVMMKYGDYVRFEEVCKWDLGKDYFLQSSRSEPQSGLTFMRLRKNDTTLIIDDNIDRDINQGIAIDIYPVFNISDNKLQGKKQIGCAAIHMLMDVGDAPKNHGRIINLSCKAILALVRGKTREKLKKYSGKQMARYENIKTKYKAILCGNLLECSYRFPAEIFETTVQKEFEGCYFSAPIGWNEFLTVSYGDYMTLPPIEEQGCKLEHIVKIDTNNCYLKYKGSLYCRND